jgi:hypothetical protein
MGTVSQEEADGYVFTPAILFLPEPGNDETGRKRGK